MSIKPILVWALLVITALDLSNGNPCKNGPTGRFCFKDLSGWYECKGEGKEMIQTTEYKCSEGTRCLCSGLVCNNAVQDPCEKFVDPPIFPPVFTLYYNAKRVSCDPKVCNTSYFNGDDFQNANKGKLRQDQTAIFYESLFVLPKSKPPGYDTFDARWDQTKCTKGSTDTFPRFRIAADFTYAGQIVKEGVTYDQWIKTSGQGSLAMKETWLTKKNDADHDIPWTYDNESADSEAKMNQTVTVEFPVFDEVVDEEKFVLPSFCEAKSSD